MRQQGYWSLQTNEIFMILIVQTPYVQMSPERKIGETFPLVGI
jgi:hypothetical protein